MSELLQQGAQIACIPDHANGDILHSDVEFGFVTSPGPGGYFCRYWSKYSPGELRTKANSELTPDRLLVRHISRQRMWIDKALEEWCQP